MGGATVPTPGGGVGQMAFPSASEPNPILRGLRGTGPEQVINQINGPQTSSSGSPTGTTSTTPNTPPNYNFPTMLFSAPQNFGYYWSINPQGQASLLPGNVDQTGALQQMPYSFSSQLTNNNTQISPTSELSYLQSVYPYTANPSLAGTGLFGSYAYPNYWSSNKMTQWTGPGSLGYLKAG